MIAPEQIGAPGASKASKSLDFLPKNAITEHSKHGTIKRDRVVAAQLFRCATASADESADEAAAPPECRAGFLAAWLPQCPPAEQWQHQCSLLGKTFKKSPVECSQFRPQVVKCTKIVDSSKNRSFSPPQKKTFPQAFSNAFSKNRLLRWARTPTKNTPF